MGVELPGNWSDDLAEVLLDEAQLQTRVEELARALQERYSGLNPLVIGVLSGAFIFMGDLVRRLNFPVELAFLRASSYGDQACSSGEVAVAAAACPAVCGRHVLVVEDIVDTGRTLARLVEVLQEQGAASVAICCLLDKQERREVPVAVDYCGFSIPDAFVVGYGLDYAGRYRHLPFVAILKPEAYQTIDQ